MRKTRTVDENRILDRIVNEFSSFGIIHPIVFDPEVIDVPDAVACHSGGRLGIEISRLDFEDYCKWLNTPPEPPYSRAGEVTINLNKMLSTVMDKKKDKYDTYIKERNLNECWLILFNNLFDFKEIAKKEGQIDRHWFETHSRYALQNLQCPYDRVLFNLDHPNRWYSIFDKQNYIKQTSVINSWPTMIYKEASITGLKKPQVHKIKFDENIKKERFE